MPSVAITTGRIGENAGLFRWIAVALLAASLTALGAPRHAAAGTYTALGCTKDGLAPIPETAIFESTAPGWRADNLCGRDGLRIQGATNPTPAYSSARWVISAPSGLRFKGGYFKGYAEATSQHRPRYLYRVAGTANPTEVGPVTAWQSQPAWHNWLSPNVYDISADQLVIEQRCTAAGGCQDGWFGLLYASDFVFQIEDVAQPAVTELTGSLMEEPAQRGTQLLEVAASDQGSGVRRIELRANGDLIGVKELGCALDGAGNGLRLAPCPATATVDFAVDTADQPFVEGKNALEVCASDYALTGEDPTSFPEESCTSTRVYVDNSCDVSQSADAAEVRFAFGRGSKDRRTVRYGRRARVVGKLTDAAGGPIDGANVCVSERVQAERAPEVDLAAVQTNKRGKAMVELPKGASRRVKLTYWADEEQVEIRTASLKVRARPKLRVLSKRKLSDGGRARFRVKLAGPYRGKRKVAVQALAPAGWLDVPGCTGKTNRRGVFRCSYQFRQQSGDVKYKFRALAPRQPGYPYLQGRTRSMIIVVRH